MSDELAQEPVVEEPAVAEAPDTEAHEAVSDDPWEILKSELGDEFDPKLVVKNYKQYTQTHQELAEERKSLEAEREIRQAFQDDPAFAEHVMSYQQKRQEDMDAKELASEALRRVQAQEANLHVQKELTDLHETVVAKYGKDADFDDAALLDTANRFRIADLEAAYLKLKSADLLSSVQKRVVEQEKEKKAAGVETRVKQSAATTAPKTKEQWAALDDDAFWREYNKAQG